MEAKRYNTITKITCPVLFGIIKRQRLFTHLDMEKNKRIIWVSGPGGSGKTTLVASFLASRKVPTLWYQADAGDADLATFFYYLSLAAKKAAPKARKPLPILTPEYLLGVEVFARRYFEGLYGRLKKPSAIVIDNYQDVPPGSGLHEIIHAGFSQVPEGLQIILISRNEPPFALMRLQANNVMAVLRWDELRLDPIEIEEFVRLKLGKRLEPEALRRLRDTTDGWAAGLVLMVEGGASEKAMTPAQTTLPKERIFEYFAAEVFERLGKETQELLLKTAYLPKLTAAMAHKLTSLDKAEQILSDLNRHNFFTTKHAQHDTAYQYHPLFREFLLAHCGRVFSMVELTSLKIGTAIILEEAGQGEAAVELFQQAGDWQNAARLIASLAPGIIAQGRALVVQGWAARFPLDALERAPWLLYWRGIAMMPYSPVKSREDFERTFELFKGNDDRAGLYLSWAGAVDSIFFGSEFTMLDRLISIMGKMRREYPEFPSEEIEAVVGVGMFSALAWRQPSHHEIPLWETRAWNVLRAFPDENLRIKSGMYIVVYNLWVGEVDKARSALDILFETVKSEKVTDFMRLSVKTTEALYLFFTGACETCVKTVRETIALAGKTGIHVWDVHVTEHGIAAALSMGDLGLAETLLKTINTDPAAIRRLDYAVYQLIKAWECMSKASMSAAIQACQEATDLFRNIGFIPAIAASCIFTCEALYEYDKKEEARHYLSQAYKIAISMKSSMLAYMCYIIEADQAYSSEQERKGLGLLRKAMKLGRDKGFSNMYLWRPEVMANLCAKALEAGIETEYVQSLIRRRGLVPVENSIVPENWPYPLQVHTLGRFEILEDGKPVVFSGKAQQKPLALLKALIALGGEAVPEERIADALWPEADGYSAHRSCELALYRLRKILGNDNAVRLHAGKLTLDLRHCSVDVRNLERMIEMAEQGWRALQEDVKGKRSEKERVCRKDVVQLTEKILSQYKGHFLTGDVKEPWTSALRDRLKSKFIHFTGMLGRHWEEEGKLDLSAACFQKGIEIDDLCEEFYQRLMVCNLKLGRKAEAATTYQCCCNRLLTALGITPSSITEEIYRAISSA
ncbi:MAG: hypothetical protein M0R70_00830 [Nitrospirae bacterium]|nr:hypothetical protein [Nitrospirota bacterium]